MCKNTEIQSFCHPIPVKMKIVCYWKSNIVLRLRDTENVSSIALHFSYVTKTSLMLKECIWYILFAVLRCWKDNWRFVAAWTWWCESFLTHQHRPGFHFVHRFPRSDSLCPVPQLHLPRVHSPSTDPESKERQKNFNTQITVKSCHLPSKMVSWPVQFF